MGDEDSKWDHVSDYSDRPCGNRKAWPFMNPVERLRYVAQARGADPGLVACEAADALVALASIQPEGLLTACRRLIERNLAFGTLWWLSARMLRSEDPEKEGADAAAELADDATFRYLADSLDGVGVVVVVGWPDVTAGALRLRGDVEVLVVDWESEGAQLVRRLRDWGSQATLVPAQGAATAAVVADAVLVEAFAAGPGGVVATPGSLAAAAMATHQQIPVWAVAGVGRVLPAALWDTLMSCLDASGVEPWDRSVELVPATLISGVVGPSFAVSMQQGSSESATAVEVALHSSTCPAAPELLRISEGPPD